MMRLDLVTHPAPPLRFPLPLFLDAASVTATAIARVFAGHRMTACPMWVALRTSKQPQLARSPRDHRYHHQHLLHLASIDAVFPAYHLLGPVAVPTEVPL